MFDTSVVHLLFLYSNRRQRTALSRVVFKRFARKDRRRKVEAPPLHAKFITRTKTKTMEKDYAALFTVLYHSLHTLLQLLHSTSQLCILPPSGLSIHLTNALLYAHRLCVHKNWSVTLFTSQGQCANRHGTRTAEVYFELK